MKEQTASTKRIQQTRITIRSHEKIIVWNTVNHQENEPADGILLSCPHCGEKVFRLEIQKELDEVRHEINLSERK